MLNFCTLFDSNYLSRGIAMYESLQKHCNRFHLYIFAFDDKSYEILAGFALANATIISLKDFEDRELLQIKGTRSSREYCWTCTPSTILYCINKYKLEMCTYLDADIYFFSDPLPLIEEMGNDSVLITGHRYTPVYDQTETSGKYCVQFISFNHDKNGMKVLRWWRNACLKWCFAYTEDGKFGDQKYLDDWKFRFEGVHELGHLGGGVAPWNVQQYNIVKKKGIIIGKEKTTGNIFDIVFYHFHHLKFFKDNIVQLTADYVINSNVKRNMYKEYISHLIDIEKNILLIDNYNDYLLIESYNDIKPRNIVIIISLIINELKITIKAIFNLVLLKNVYHRVHSYNIYLLKNILN